MNKSSYVSSGVYLEDGLIYRIIYMYIYKLKCGVILYDRIEQIRSDEEF